MAPHSLTHLFVYLFTHSPTYSFKKCFLSTIVPQRSPLGWYQPRLEGVPGFTYRIPTPMAPVGSSLLEEGKMGEGATGGLETDPSSKGIARGSSGSQREHSLGSGTQASQPGCWSIGIPCDPTYMHSAKPLASLGLHFLVCEVE